MNMLLRNRYVVAATALVLGLLVGLVLLLLPRTYTTESSFMLQSRNSIPSNISGLASQFGFSLPVGEPKIDLPLSTPSCYSRAKSWGRWWMVR